MAGALATLPGWSPITRIRKIRKAWSNNCNLVSMDMAPTTSMSSMMGVGCQGELLPEGGGTWIGRSADTRLRKRPLSPCYSPRTIYDASKSVTDCFPTTDTACKKPRQGCMRRRLAPVSCASSSLSDISLSFCKLLDSFIGPLLLNHQSRR